MRTRPTHVASTFEQVSPTAVTVLALLALLVGIVALTLASVALARASRTPTTLSPAPARPLQQDDDDAEPDPVGPPAVVLNPSKNVDWPAIKRLLVQTAHEVGLPEPVFYETTVEDPGAGQARAALEAGASVVVAAGGDGTVRSVASTLAGTGTPMALLPMGTGNLLARNLDLTLSASREMIKTALTGRDRPIDVGWVRTELLTPEEEVAALRSGVAEVVQDELDLAEHGVRQSSPDKEHIFLVIAGVGLDANMVAGTDEDLKSRIGWMAYIVAALKPMLGRRVDFRLRIGDSPRDEHMKARTIMVANCGKLPVGVTLLPDAKLDDGWLDLMAVDTRGGVIGWASFGGKIVLQGVGIRNEADVSSRIEYRRGKAMAIHTSHPEAVQVDGDLVGLATSTYFRVQPGGLIVRTG
ncbi:MAG: diacylglycerol kinase [Actinobacteria bacterium]|nr:diacylglycerol kinase [Actinomycetota bacterium]